MLWASSPARLQPPNRLDLQLSTVMISKMDRCSTEAHRSESHPRHRNRPLLSGILRGSMEMWIQMDLRHIPNLPKTTREELSKSNMWRQNRKPNAASHLHLLQLHHPSREPELVLEVKDLWRYSQFSRREELFLPRSPSRKTLLPESNLRTRADGGRIHLASKACLPRLDLIDRPLGPLPMLIISQLMRHLQSPLRDQILVVR